MSDLTKGRIVRLIGLKPLYLNKAIGRVSGALDPVSGRHEVTLLSPPEAVAAHPSGVKIRTENLEITDPASVPEKGFAVLVRAGAYATKEELLALMRFTPLTVSCVCWMHATYEKVLHVLV